MKTIVPIKALLVCLCGILIQVGCASDEVKKAEIDIGEISEYATITATVAAIDHEKREITLKRADGSETTFIVDNRVKRLNEINAGDKIKLDYFISLASEIREPTEEEKNEPLTVLEGLERAPGDTSPAAGGLRRIKAVVTIMDIDRSRQLVTMKGPLGRYITIRAMYPERLELVEIGDSVIVTYTEALAVSVEKVE